MKNNKKIIALTTSIILLFIFGTFLLPVAKADVKQYEQQTDRLNPFLFSVDTIYTMSSYDYHMKNDSFHQAVLDEDNFYVFYIKSNLVRYNMTVWIQIKDGSERYFREDCGDGEYELLMTFHPQKTGLFEIIISNRNYHTTNDLQFEINEIGILEVPKYVFNYNLDYNRNETEIQEKWDSQHIVFGIVHLERFIDYEIISGYKIYVGHSWNYYLIGDSKKLNGNNPFEKQYTSGDVFNVSAEGDYLFYELLGNPFEIHYRDPLPDIPYFDIRPIVALIITIGVIIGLAVGIVLVVKHKKKKRKAETQVQKVIKPNSFYCSNCGAENRDMTSGYCSNCGNKWQ